MEEKYLGKSSRRIRLAPRYFMRRSIKVNSIIPRTSRAATDRFFIFQFAAAFSPPLLRPAMNKQ